MNQTQLGWTVFVAAIGMMLSLLAGDVAHLEKWSDALYPSFLAGVMTHLGAVLAAFVGGKLLPTQDHSVVSEEKRAELSSPRS